jgi:hypothetical protein
LAEALTEVEAEPVASTYKFSYEVPEEVIAGESYTVPVKIEPETVGDVGYERVRFNVEVTTPDGATLQLLATDTNGDVHDVAQIGYWGPENGFPIDANYSATTEFTAIFSTPGTYTITFSLVDLDAGEALVTETVTIEVIGAVGPVEALITDLPEVPDDPAPELPDFSKPKPDGEKLTAIYNYLAYLENAEAVAAAQEAFNALDPSDQARVDEELRAKLDAAVAKISELEEFVIDNTTIGVGTYKEDYSGLTEGAKGRIMVSVQWPFRVADGFNTEEGLTSIEEYLYNDERGELVRNVAVLDKMNPSTTGNWPCNLSGSFDLGVQRISSSGSWNNGLYELSGDEVTQADLPDKVVVEFTYKGVQFVIEEEVTLTPEMFAVEAEPVASTYKFSYEVPEEVIAGESYTVPVKIEPETVGDVGYERVRFNVEVTTPDGATLQLLATDTNGDVHDVAQIGYWGPENGFPIDANYSATTEFTAIFSTPGTYTITFSLVDLDAGEALVTETVTIEVIGAVGPVEALITDLPEVPDDPAPELPDFSKPKPDGEKLTAIYNYLAYLENAEAVAAAQEAFNALDPSDQARVDEELRAKLDAAVAKISELEEFVIDNTTIGVGTYKEDYSGLTEGAKGRIMVSVQWPFRVADGFNTEEGLTSIEEYLYNDERGELVRNVAVLDKMNPSTTGNWPCNLSGSFDLGVQRISSSGSWNNGLYELSGDEVTQADLPDKVVVEFTYKGVQFVIEEEVTLTPEMFAEPSNDASITGITVSGVAATVDTGDEEGLDVTPLEDAIEAAEAAKESIVVSEDGADVPTGAYWVTQADIDALDAAIAKAEAAKETVEIQQGVDNAVAELEAVIATASMILSKKRYMRKK